MYIFEKVTYEPAYVIFYSTFAAQNYEVRGTPRMGSTLGNVSKTARERFEVGSVKSSNFGHLPLFDLN